MNAPPTAVPQLLTPQQVDVYTDTRDLLAHAKRDSIKRKYRDWFICDIDAHHVETVSWKEIITYIEDPVVREQAIRFQSRSHRRAALRAHRRSWAALPERRRTHSAPGRPARDRRRTDVHRDVTLTRRAMDAMAIDYMVVFPTPMLFLGMHPQPEMEVWLGNAYNNWLADKLLSADDRIKSLIYLPFNTPEEAERTVEALRRHQGRDRLLHHLDPLQAGPPQSLHAALSDDRGARQAARVPCRLSLAGSLACHHQPLPRHACARASCGATSCICTNWIINGIPERFPKLKPFWVESGLAWVPFLMQRLDDQYLMRPSEAPQLKRLPSEYMRENCFYTTQPMETTNLRRSK